MTLEKLLIQKGLVKQAPSKAEILERAGQVSRPLKIFYGETYDEEGNPLDSVKYYLFVSALAKKIKEEGFEARPQILIADVAACRNVGESLNVKYVNLGEKRADFVKKLNDEYDLGLEVIKMSDYLFGEDFQNKVEGVKRICQADSRLMEMVERSVPESKIDIERKKGFAYSFDEIATIIDLDVKVGPPREDLYDGIAREVANREGNPGLMSLFLTPTFPVGKNWAYFFSNEGIEDHGITAYKAGSKRLQDHRIIIGKTTREDARALIEGSFISANPELPNPVLDLGMICEMARKLKTGEDFPITLYDDFYSGRLSPEELKLKVEESLYNNFLE